MCQILNNNNVSNDPIHLSKESINLLEKIKKINSSYFFTQKIALASEIKKMQAEELTQVLKCYFEEILDTEEIGDPVQFLERLASVISPEQLSEIYKAHSTESSVEYALKKAHNMLSSAKLAIQNDDQTSPAIRQKTANVIDAFLNITENFVNGLAIADFFQPADSEAHANVKSQKMMMVLSFFMTLAHIIVPLFAPEIGPQVVGGLFLFIIALSLIWPAIKPKPKFLPHAEYWSNQLEQDLGIEGRRTTLHDMADSLSLKNHVILIGHSRVGKSLTARAFAKAIAKGEFPELKGKLVFRINLAEIATNKSSFQGGNAGLKDLLKAMGRHRENIILVFDGIHIACKNNASLADQLKTMLDEAGGFPYVIGITTYEEYKYVKENNAFSLRFNPIEVKNTNQDETLEILSHEVLRRKDIPLLEPGVLKYIYEKSTKDVSAMQPNTSIKILRRCIKLVSTRERTELQNKINEAMNKTKSLIAQNTVYGCHTEFDLEIAKLEEEISELKQQAEKEKKGYYELCKKKNLLNKITKESFRTALKLEHVSGNALKNQDKKNLNLLILLHAYWYKILKAHIQEKTQELGIKLTIDKELVDNVMKSNFSEKVA